MRDTRYLKIVWEFGKSVDCSLVSSSGFPVVERPILVSLKYLLFKFLRKLSKVQTVQFVVNTLFYVDTYFFIFKGTWQRNILSHIFFKSSPNRSPCLINVTVTSDSQLAITYRSKMFPFEVKFTEWLWRRPILTKSNVKNSLPWSNKIQNFA